VWRWLKETQRRERVRARSERRAADPKQRNQLDICRLEYAARPESKKAKAERDAEWWEANPDKMPVYSKTYRTQHPDRVKAAWENWAEKNPGYTAKRCRENIQLRIIRNNRKRVWDALKGFCKSKSTALLLGCSGEELMRHLEKQFKPGMTWDNYGEWHMDHKRPCASFDMADPEQQKTCFHFSNYQPLWAKENYSKSDKWEGPA
jgi:hypothetical protein